MSEDKQETASLNASEVLQVLADVELEGIEFYSYLAENSQNPKLRKAAIELMEAEQRHRARFLDYAHNYRQYAEKHIGFELLPTNLRMLHNIKLFPSSAVLILRTPPATDKELVRIAIKAEHATAALVEAFMPYVLTEHRGILRKVVKEEIGHVKRLERFLKRYFPENRRQSVLAKIKSMIIPILGSDKTRATSVIGS